MISDLKGKFWFSEAQYREQLIESMPAIVNSVYINGREVTFTEWKFGAEKDNLPEWEDAIYLGEVG